MTEKGNAEGGGGEEKWKNNSRGRFNFRNNPEWIIIVIIIIIIIRWKFEIPG